jgi:uncharacterized Zn-binding protein involved in type VI secretion
MRQAAAKDGDQIIATDIHMVLVPAGSALVPVPLPHPFTGTINDGLSSNVNIMGRRAAMVGSTAVNVPGHLPTTPGQGFQRPPANAGTIKQGSQSVNINGQPAARNGDIAETCNDPSDLPAGSVVAVASVFVG